MLRFNADVYHGLTPETDGPYPDKLISIVKGHIITSKLMLEGTSKLIATYLPAIARCSQFQRIWQRLMETLIAYLDCHIHDLDAAVYKSLTELLSNVLKPQAIGSEAVQQAAGIWARHFPESKPHPLSNANQEALEAYIRSLKEIYRLIESDIKPEVVRYAHFFVMPSSSSILMNIWRSETEIARSSSISMLCQEFAKCMVRLWVWTKRLTQFPTVA